MKQAASAPDSKSYYVDNRNPLQLDWFQVLTAERWSSSKPLAEDCLKGQFVHDQKCTRFLECLPLSPHLDAFGVSERDVYLLCTVTGPDIILFARITFEKLNSNVPFPKSSRLLITL